MKKSVLLVTLLASLVLGSRALQAQVYTPYYYNPYWDPFQYQQYQNYLQWQQYLAYLQQVDPYYDLHVMHYQLYLQPYQRYQLYQPCCYTWDASPQWSAPVIQQPLPAIGPRGLGVVGPLPGAVAPLPRGATPLPRATGRR